MRQWLVVGGIGLVAGLGGAAGPLGATPAPVSVQSAVQPIPWPYAESVMASLCPDAFPRPMIGIDQSAATEGFHTDL